MLSLTSALPQPALQPDESARAQRFQSQLTAGGRTPEGKPKDTKSSAAELSSLFVAQMLAAMRRTVPKSGLLDKGFAHETYVAMFDQEIARHVARREDFGLTAMLQRQLKGPDTDRQLRGRPVPLLQRPSAVLSPQSAALSARKGPAIDAYRQQAAPTDSMFMMPVEGRQTSPFGMRLDPLGHTRRRHDGMDIAAAVGTPIRAAAAGRVIFSGRQAGYGKVVVVQHAEGYSTLYAHNRGNLVAVGAAVSQGQLIATVGRSGRVTGPHLHFEVRKDGQQLDPASFLEAGSAPKPALLLEAKNAQK